MNDYTSRRLVEKIEYTLKKVTNDVLNNHNRETNLEEVLVKKVHAVMSSLSRSISFTFSIPREIEVKNISYSPKTSSNGIIAGDIIIAHCQKRDPYKYGEPGYPGKEDGQLCEYPEHSGKFYKWSSYLCRWEDIYESIDRGNNGQGWYDKLTKNAAFEPWWGSNSGMDGIKSDRKRNGADDLWGDPGIRKFGGSFKKISADVMKSIYNFSYDFRSVLKHYIKLSDAFGYGDEEVKLNESTDTTVYNTEEEPMVKITIQKLDRWHVWGSNGSIHESGMGVRKDTLVYIKDIDKVREYYKDKADGIKKKARKKFDNGN